MEKRPFLLLELLIAMTLFCMCMVPLAQIPTTALRSEIKTYQRLALHRIADLTLADVKAALYQNQIPWEQLSSKNKSSFPLDKIAIDLPGIGRREVDRSCTLFTASAKEGAQGEQYRLIHLQIQLKGLSKRRAFHYKLLVAAQPERFKISLAEILPSVKEGEKP